MKRRAFLKTAVTTAAGLAGTAAMTSTTQAAPAAATSGAREYYELRTYTVTAAQWTRLEEYFGKAFIPALNRFGITPVGVFTEKTETPEFPVFVLIPFKSLDDIATLSDKLEADAKHQQDGAAHLGATATDRAFVRVESSVMVAFEGHPKLKAPAKGPRQFQLRTYESHGERAGKKKIEMFNKGEIAIFERVGLTPVFFGETILGSRMPNLTYMLGFPDQAAQDKAWGTFRTDAEWVKLKSIPGYADKDIVSKITNRVVKPAGCSQI